MAGPRPTSPLSIPTNTPAAGHSTLAGVARPQGPAQTGTWRSPASAERTHHNRAQSAPSTKKLIDLARRPATNSTAIPAVLHSTSPVRAADMPTEPRSANSVESTPRSTPENVAMPEKTEEPQARQTLPEPAQPVIESPKTNDLPELPAQQARLESPAPKAETPVLPAGEPVLAGTQDIRREALPQESRADEQPGVELKKVESPKINDLPELPAQQARSESPAPKVEAPALAVAEQSLVRNQDIQRKVSQPDGRTNEQTRLELKKIQMLLAEQQQANREHFERLILEQRLLAERVALLSRAIEEGSTNTVADVASMPEVAEPAPAELAKPKEAQQQEFQQMQKTAQVQQLPTPPGQRRSLQEAFKKFKKLA